MKNIPSAQSRGVIELTLPTDIDFSSSNIKTLMQWTFGIFCWKKRLKWWNDYQEFWINFADDLPVDQTIGCFSSDFIFEHHSSFCHDTKSLKDIFL